MATQATKGLGTKIAVDDGAGGYDDIPEVLTITPYALETQEIDVTNMDSDAREFIGGIPDFGECSFEINFLPSNSLHLQLQSDAQDGTRRSYRVAFTDAGQSAAFFNAIVKRFAPTANVNEQLKATVTLRVTNAVVLGVVS